MKQKAFGFIAIFLVIFQLFSPFIINFSENKISIDTNVSTAAELTPRIGYKEYKGSDSSIAGVVFVYVDVRETSNRYYNVDVDFYVNSGNFENKSGANTIFTEIIDSDSDEEEDWQYVEKITENSTEYKRHYYAYYVKKSTSFPLYISALNDDSNDDVFEEKKINSATDFFGPNIPTAISGQQTIRSNAIVYTPEPRVGYIKDYVDGAGEKHAGLVFAYVDTLESSGKCWDSDINFYISSENDAWDYVDEVIDSYSDCTNSLNDWHTEKLNTSSGKVIRHYYGEFIAGYTRVVQMEEGGWIYDNWIEINKNNQYGSDETEVLIESTTSSFGPTPSNSILRKIDGTDKNEESSIASSFDVKLSVKPFLSDIDSSKIINEYIIEIDNKGEKWQDDGRTKDVPDGEDSFGSWDSIYDDNLLKGDAGVEKDITPDPNGSTNRFNSFDGFILDISTSKDFKQADTTSINLNPLILEGKSKDLPLFNAGKMSLKISLGYSAGKSFIAKPDTTIDIPGLTENTTYHYRVRVYPDNKREILMDSATLSTLARFEDPQIYSYTSNTIPPKGNLDVIQDSRSSSSLLEKSGQDSEFAWLPECDADDMTTWFQGCLVVGFYYIVYTPTAFLLGVAGSVMDFVLAYSIQPDSYQAEYIKDAWRFIRDVCNLFFIFMLLYLAFKLVLGVGSGTKQLIVNTLVIATVINFSYPLTTVVIDVSNITARQLYYNSFSRNEGEDGKPVSLSSTAAEGYNPQAIILDGLEKNSETFKVGENKGTVFMILLMGVIFNVIAILTFLKIAVQFIYRIIGLIFAIILSPLAVFSFSLEPKQRGGLKMVGFETWLNGLITDAFKAPVFLFLILILALFVRNNPFSAVFGDGVVGLEWWMSLIIPFMLVIGFLTLIEKVTKGMTSQIGQLAGGYVMKGIAGVAGFGAAIATGGAAWAGRNVIGKKASTYMQSTKGEKLMTKAAEGNTWARLKVGALDMARKGSFDLRQNKAAGAVTGFTGVNMQAGTNYIPFFGKQFQTATSAGGYMAQMQRKTARMKKFEESLGFDQEMYNKMEDVKEKAQRAANNQEDIINGLKERADSKFSEMRYHQQKAREHGADLIAAQKKTKDKEIEIESKQKEIDKETDATKKDLLIKEKLLLEDNKKKLKEEEAKHEENQKQANVAASLSGEEEKKLRGEIKIEKDKLDALKGDGYTYIDEKTGKAVHVLGVKGAEKAMEKVKTDRIDRYKQFQREKSGKIFKRKTGLDVYKEKIEKDLEEAETDEKIAKRPDVVEIMEEVTNKAKTDKDWDDTNEDKKKELINKYKKDTEILNKHAKKRIYEAVYNSLDVDSMEGEAKEKALKDVEEAARDIEHLTYQLKSSPSGTRSKIGAMLNDSFLHTDVAKGSVLGAPFGWLAAPTAIATGLVRMAEYDRKFYENYGRSWQDKDTKVDTTDKYKPGK